MGDCDYTDRITCLHGTVVAKHCFVFEISTLLPKVNFILEYTGMIDSFTTKNDNGNEVNWKRERGRDQLRQIKAQK
jgi:hypothetical protein